MIKKHETIQVGLDDYKLAFEGWLERIEEGNVSTLDLKDYGQFTVYNRGNSVEIVHMKKKKVKYRTDDFLEAAEYLFEGVKKKHKQDVFSCLKSQKKGSKPLQYGFTENNKPSTMPSGSKLVKEVPGKERVKEIKEVYDEQVGKIKKVAEVLGLSYNKDVGDDLEAYGDMYSRINKRISLMKAVSEFEIPEVKGVEKKLPEVEKILKNLKESAEFMNIDYSEDIDHSMGEFKALFDRIKRKIGLVKQVYSKSQDELEKLSEGMITIKGTIQKIIPYLEVRYPVFEFYNTAFPQLELSGFLKKLEPAKKVQNYISRDLELDKKIKKLEKEKRKASGSSKNKFRERIMELKERRKGFAADRKKYKSDLEANFIPLLKDMTEASRKIRKHIDDNNIVEDLTYNLARAKAASVAIVSYRDVFEELGIELQDKKENTVADYLVNLKDLNKDLGRIQSETKRLYRELIQEEPEETYTVKQKIVNFFSKIKTRLKKYSKTAYHRIKNSVKKSKHEKDKIKEPPSK